MDERVIPLSWTHLESMTETIDRQLSTWDVPTVLRLRAQVVLEELFSARFPLRHAAYVPRVMRIMPDRNNTNQPQSNSFRRFCTAET